MRQGPNYSMWIDLDSAEPNLPIPLELCHELEDYDFIEWKDNGDGTYTLTPGLHK